MVRLEPGANPEPAIERLLAIRGIGDWTANYIAMRALRWPDAFPAGDLGLIRGAGAKSPAALREAAESWGVRKATRFLCGDAFLESSG